MAGEYTTPTGFLEFAPRDPATQAKYSALSSTWEGVESSEKAVADGKFDLQKADATSQDKRAKYVPGGPPEEKKQESAWDSPEAFWRYIRKSLGYE